MFGHKKNDPHKILKSICRGYSSSIIQYLWSKMLGVTIWKTINIKIYNKSQKLYSLDIHSQLFFKINAIKIQAFFPSSITKEPIDTKAISPSLTPTLSLETTY